MDRLILIIEQLEKALLPQNTLVNESYSFLFLIFILFMLSVFLVNIIATLINLVLKWRLRSLTKS